MTLPETIDRLSKLRRSLESSADAEHDRFYARESRADARAVGEALEILRSILAEQS